MDKSSALTALSALSQETRLDVFQLLVATGPEPMPAGDIASRLDVLPNTLSSHLAILHRAGLVRAERSGRVIRYAADYDGMRDLMAFLMRDCCGGRPEICAPLVEIAEHANTCVGAAP
ncbi:MAG: metalloregulator ArsR/SmtB family transcription factor [Pseudomonadota bacterium]